MKSSASSSSQPDPEASDWTENRFWRTSLVLVLQRFIDDPFSPSCLIYHNGSCRSQSSLDEEAGGAPAFEKLNPYPPPPPPHPLYPGRKVIEFSSDDKVKIPKNSPLPNCTYATRQAISLSLVQNDDERVGPGSPAPSSSSGGGGGANQHTPPSQRDAAPSVPASSASSEEDLLSNWQRMFVEKMAPSSEGSVMHRTSFSSQTAQELQRRRGSSLDTDTDTEPQPEDETEEDDSSAEERDVLPRELPAISPRLLEFDPAPGPQRPMRSPKRMGVHHLHRKDSLTRAQEQGSAAETSDPPLPQLLMNYSLFSIWFGSAGFEVLGRL
uniref:Tight junction-associated protein 1 domain-containing protein n=1 Tax=Xiphophorus couchianus TaxID=32473 RepID=A0A3B5L3M7_9TELE